MSLFSKTAALALVTLGGLAAPAAAQTPQAVSREQATPQALEIDRDARRQVILEGQNATQTREQLRRLFEQYPPSVRDVLRRDTSLLNNAPYLSTYPALSAFLTQHPEVAHNPVFYLGSPGESYQSSDPSTVKVRAVQSMFEGLTVMAGFLGFFTLIGFVTKSLIEHRRWGRASKVQTEAHAKVIDRLSSNEDLLAYIQTPAGQRYLESMPPSGLVAEGPMSAPYSRILWSVQAGVVSTLVGVGFLFVAGRWATDADWSGDFSRMLFLVGVVTLAAGVGFVLSGLASAILSRRFGLIPSSAPHA